MRLRISTFIAIVLWSAALAPAQVRARRPAVVTPGAGVIPANMGAMISDIERRTDEFKSAYDRCSNYNPVNHTRRGDDVWDQVKRLERETDQVKREWEHRKTYEDIRSNVVKASNAGRDVDVAMRARRFGGDCESRWAALRNELNRLAAAFNVPRI